MNTPTTTPIPDSTSIVPELEMRNTWDTQAVSDLIRSKSRFGETPAFLFLGKSEAALLREHLASAFGAEAVATLHQTYYMGLEVVEIDTENFIFTAGRKVSRTLQDPISRRPAWRDANYDSLWHFRV